MSEEDIFDFVIKNKEELVHLADMTIRSYDSEIDLLHFIAFAIRMYDKRKTPEMSEEIDKTIHYAPFQLSTDGLNGTRCNIRVSTKQVTIFEEKVTCSDCRRDA